MLDGKGLILSIVTYSIILCDVFLSRLFICVHVSAAWDHMIGGVVYFLYGDWSSIECLWIT